VQTLLASDEDSGSHFVFRLSVSAVCLVAWRYLSYTKSYSSRTNFLPDTSFLALQPFDYSRPGKTQILSATKHGQRLASKLAAVARLFINPTQRDFQPLRQFRRRQDIFGVQSSHVCRAHPAPILQCCSLTRIFTASNRDLPLWHRLFVSESVAVQGLSLGQSELPSQRAGEFLDSFLYFGSWQSSAIIAPRTRQN